MIDFPDQPTTIVPEASLPLGHPVQALMSRTGSFPLSVAYDLLRTYAKRESVVFDPFCGKGTTLLAARMLGHSAYGMDVGPEAVVCSSAKLATVDLESVREYVSQMDFCVPTAVGPSSELQTFFHDSTYAQLIAARDRIMADINSEESNKRDNATFSLAALLGILHGHATYSLSISSAHAYSMAPAYVRRYAATNGLVPPLRDVKECLLKKITRSLARPLPPPVPWEVRRGSALSAIADFAHLEGMVDVILTSPPYLNSQTYAKDNWLRLWLLGFDYKELRRDYIETGRISLYGEQMSEVLSQLFRLLRPGGLFICIAGDVRLRARRRKVGKESLFRTGDFLAGLCASPKIGFNILYTGFHTVPSHRRYLHALTASNGHASIPRIERLFIASKPESLGG